MKTPFDYPASAVLALNHYGNPIIWPEIWEGEHYAAIVPTAAGLPPACSCGWTRHYGLELSDHLADMNDGYSS